jgi:hypothetical protein
MSSVTWHFYNSILIASQDGSGDLDLAELNAVLASISGGAMSAGGGSGGGDVSVDNNRKHPHHDRQSSRLDTWWLW